MKQSRRFLSAALSLLLSLSLFTPAVIAEEETEERPEEVLEPAAEEEAPAASEEAEEEKEPETGEPAAEEVNEEVPEAEPAAVPEEILPEEAEEERESEALSAEEEPEAERFAVPEGFAVSAEDLRAKEAMKENNAAAALETMEEGVDYERSVLLTASEERTYAETAASIYGGELVSFEYGIGIIRLREEGPSVRECVLACLEEENLPFVEPNYITPIEKEESLERESEGEGYQLPKEKTWGDWVSALNNPDPFLLNPTEDYYSWHLSEIGAYTGWNATMGNSEIKVGVIDTFINPEHEELAGKVTNFDIGRGEYFGTNGHGTQMAGVIASSINNAAGGAGIAPNVKLIGINIFYYNSETKTDTYNSADLVKAINLATDEGVSIINLSLGAPAYSRHEEEAIARAASKGVTVVVSAGNDGSNVQKFPACYNNVITVGATAKNGARAYFSNYGSWVTVSAPGVEIPAPMTSNEKLFNNTYTLSSGTSPAAAVVSGSLALYMSRFGKITPKESAALVKRCVHPCSSSGMGSGIIDIDKMFKNDSKAPVLKVFNKNGEVVTDFSKPLEKECYLVIESPNAEDNETIIYTTEGHLPVIRDGEVVRGYVYEPGTRIMIDDFEMSTTKTIAAVVVNSFGTVGKLVTLSLKTPLPPVEPVKIKTLKLDHLTASIRVSDSQEIHETVQILPSSIINEKGEAVDLKDLYYEYVTSDSDVATVDVNGKVTAVSAGTATIKLKILDGSNKTASCMVTVVQLAESAVIEGQNSIVPGGTFLYKTVISPVNTKSKKVQWYIAEPVKGVSVDSLGRVKVASSVKAGTVFTVAAKCKDGSGVVAEKTVEVAPKAKSIRIESDDPRVTRNAKNVITNAYAYTVDIQDGYHPAADNEIVLYPVITGNDIAPKWISTNTKVATVDSTGKVKAHAPGKTTIYVQTMDGSKKVASMTLEVRVPISSLSIDTELDYLVVPGKTLDFGKKIAFESTYGDPSIKKADWSLIKFEQNGTDITEDVLKRNLVTVANGKVTVSGNIEKYYPIANGAIAGTVKAKAKDGTGFYVESRFSIVKPAKISWIDRPGEKSTTANLDKIYSVPLFTDSLTNFEVSSSNPELAGVFINNSDYSEYSYEQDGKIISGYKFTLKLITNDKKGTFVINVKHLNGSGMTNKLQVRLVDD